MNKGYEQEYIAPAFRNVRDLDQAVRAHEELAREVGFRHEDRFLVVLNRHEGAFAMEVDYPGTHDWDTEQRLTNIAIQSSFKQVKSETHAVVYGAHDAALRWLDPTARSLYMQTKFLAQAYGIGSQAVSDAIASADNDTVKSAIGIGLDVMTYERLQRMVSTKGVESEEARQTLGQAASEWSRTIMHATTDGDVYDRVHAVAEANGVNAAAVGTALQFVSMDTVGQAIRATLDFDVLKLTKVQATAYGSNAPDVDETLALASSDSVRTVWRRILNSDYRLYDHGTAFSSGDSGWRYREDRLWDAFSDFISSSQQRQRQPEPTPPPKRYYGVYAEFSMRTGVDVQGVIDDVVASNPKYGWLKTHPPEDIKRVVGSILELRRKREAEGRTISDREIYFAYKQQSDTDPDETLQQSMRIVDALMGGSYKNPLPF